MNKWYSIKANLEQDITELWIYDEIGESWFEDSVTAKDLCQELAGIKSSDIHVHINSPGGSVFDGQAIYTALVNHPAKVTTYVDGLAASIASVIACAGDTVVMAENAMLMVHDPWSLAVGNAADLRDAADVLDKVAESLVTVYAARTGLPADEVKAIMAAETWYTAAEAVEAGFADEVTPAKRIAAKFDLSKFQHPPKAALPELTPDEVAKLRALITEAPPERDTTRTMVAVTDLLVTARRI